MKNSFFLIEARFYESGATLMEHALMHLAREYEDCVMDDDSIQILADDLRKEQAALLKENKRLRPVKIEVVKRPDSRGLHIKAGRLYVSFRCVKSYFCTSDAWKETGERERVKTPKPSIDYPVLPGFEND